MYKIANRIIDVCGLKDTEDLSRLELFKCMIGIPEVTYQIHYVSDFSDYYSDELIYNGGQIRVAIVNGNFHYFHLWNEEIYAVVIEKKVSYDIYLDEVAFELRYHPYLIPSLFSLERLLIKDKAFVLHSSYISYDNRGIVFTAPSGGGKSTQAELWKKYRDATIVNGDKSIIDLNNNGYVHGLPFSGSSDYCINKSCPLGAIVILEKGPVNQLQRLGLEAFNTVFSQVTVNPWDSEFCEQIMDLILETCCMIPVYRYSCTKDESAVDYLYEHFKKDGVL